jgi:hypothetical protein
MRNTGDNDSAASIQPGDSLARLAHIMRAALAFGHREPTDDFALREEPVRRPPSENSHSPTLEQAVQHLFDLLDRRGVDYVLVGGLALLCYVRGRNTEDIDLMLAVDALSALPEITLSEKSEWFARGAFAGLRVDLLFTENPVFKLVRERHTGCVAFLERGVPCATPEGLLLLKLYALPSLYRQGQIQRANLYEGDITALIRGLRVDPEPLLESLEKFMLDTDIRELRRVVEEVQNRQRRF